MKNNNILIAEDEKIIALDIEGTLRALGYNCLGAARTKDEIIELAGSLKPDLVLMDIMLANGSSGIEAANVIKQEYDIPVVYLTALADNETLKKAKVTDPFGYVLKPFDSKTLNTAIEMALYKHTVSIKLRERTQELEEEKIKTDNLLRIIYPEPVIKELKETGAIEPREYKNVTLLFTDFQDFTSLSSLMHPNQLVDELNDIFKNFDAIINQYSLEKLKTVGDSYIVAGGLPLPDEQHAWKIVNAAIEMQKFLMERNSNSNYKWKMRTGIHSGSVISGVVGKTKFVYDIWGNDVNIASFMERSCLVGKVNISESTYNLVKDHFKCHFFKEDILPYEGRIKMYLTDSLQDKSSIDNDTDVIYSSTAPNSLNN
ncbi:MAG: adenylate/guanylate cyclase domain-containing protein [Bacteroidota bacterium]|nr:adenylate/guanylate cyclase domain-containing protein [Bacteroidota bacterium]